MIEFRHLFDKITSTAPQEIKEILWECSLTPQNPEWHPEGADELIPHNVLIHTKIVFFNTIKKFLENSNYPHLIDQEIAAIFHDLGKVKTTKKNKKGNWSSPGHEIESVKILERHKDWVIQRGGNFERIHSIVKNHMKIKYINEMRPFKKEKLINDSFYNDIVYFNSCDDMKNTDLKYMENEMNKITYNFNVYRRT